LPPEVTPWTRNVNKDGGMSMTLIDMQISLIDLINVQIISIDLINMQMI
jgi:hypothetical protein